MKKRKPIAGWLLAIIGGLITGAVATGGAILIQLIADELSWIWAIALFLPLFVVLFVLKSMAGAGKIYGLRLAAKRGEKVLSQDPRPPVVFLRSFEIDEDIAGVTEESLEFSSIEKQAAKYLKLRKLGPVVAVGKPTDVLPPPGALPRLYFGDKEWRKGVSSLFKDAKLVILIAGTTKGLFWELKEVVKTVPPGKLVVAVSIPVGEFGVKDDVWRKFVLGANKVLKKPLLSVLPEGLQLIVFGADWVPRYLKSNNDVGEWINSLLRR